MFSEERNELKGFNVDACDCMIDLHLHLDGAISAKSARQLAEMVKMELPESDAELDQMMQVSPDCRDLNEFLEKFELPCKLIQTKETIRQAMENLLTELKGQGLMYAEVRFAPQKSTDCGLTQEDAVLAALEGMAAVDLDAGLILSCMRGGDEKENAETIRMGEKYFGKGVVAVDLAGAEALFPTADYETLFAPLKEKDLHVTIHAGEAAGPDSMRAAIKMGAQRIGHGVRGFSDPEMVKYLAETGLPLEVCPSSGTCTGNFQTVADAPIKKGLDAGVCVTVNTDDPRMENVTIKEEFKKVIQAFDLTRDEVRTLLENAVRASFASAALKEKMMKKISENFD